MKISNIIIFLLFFTTTGYSQKPLTPTQVDDKISWYLTATAPNTPRLNKLKDSVDFYTFAIEISVIQKGMNTFVNKVSVNDSIAYVLYKDFELLKTINYTKVLNGRKNAILVIPVGIMIAYVKNPVSSTPMIKAESLMPKIVKMFNLDKNKPQKRASGYIFLNPVLCICGTKIYD